METWIERFNQEMREEIDKAIIADLLFTVGIESKYHPQLAEVIRSFNGLTPAPELVEGNVYLLYGTKNGLDDMLR